ncbi:transporter substrate-binding domain-containing protein [Psychrobium sp. MM17-31]|uniref:transporter substrate-binding domain-containing protein n=1 Tax=Psychrobium sp. MM17-31 TaxID=2917758 RepID=UPI001EF51F3F|nr:transporter substrate-binding domain-containing protein [Psychrobium sp. MM17-31]MCG7532091.1 transporter substrate-binding domain-containing protein [Psychrobium sp. MM17-31]
MLKQLVACFFTLIFLSACGEAPSQSESTRQATPAAPTATVQPAPIEPSQPKAPRKPTLVNEKRDWNKIKQLKVIRALKLKWEEPTSLPRAGVTSRVHIDLFNDFAKQHQLKVQWINVDNLAQMFELLSQHKADIIPRHLSITPHRLKSMSFSQPIMLDQELLIAAETTPSPTTEQTVKVHVPKSSAYIESIQKAYPQWTITEFADDINQEQLADDLLANKFTFTVLDKNAFDTLKHYRQGLKSLITLPETRKLAWAVALENNSLLEKLNNFIAVHHISSSTAQPRFLDLTAMKEKHLPLRMITKNSPETYFMWRGELVGFEYELMHEFAKRHKLRLEVVVADSYQEMEDLLNQGKGDVIASALTKTDSRMQQLTMSRKYHTVSELLVSHEQSDKITQLADLNGRSITVRKSSAFWQTAQQLAKEYGAIIVAADESLSTELLIAQVANQEIDLTIADSDLVAIEQKFRSNIVTPLTLNNDIEYGYAMRKDNQQLLSALNQYAKKEYRQLFFNIVKNKYFKNTKHQKQHRAKRISADSALSPYDVLVQPKAQEYQFDWRLIVAQMYQESRFNPNAKSAAGAQGLMQIMPRTGKEMGFNDLTNPEQSIGAGVQYLDWTRARFSKNLALQEQIYFSLAAYNAGFGHVKDAQLLAKQMNLRSDVWFNNVEKAMLLLQQPKYYKKARFGYCRGSEPVNYVREIQQRYLSYVDIVQ